MLLLLIAPYGFLGSCLLQTTEDTGGSLLPVFALFGVVLLCNMVYAFLLPRLGFDGRRILFWNLLLKLCKFLHRHRTFCFPWVFLKTSPNNPTPLFFGKLDITF